MEENKKKNGDGEKPFLSEEQITILRNDLLAEFKATDQEAFLTIVQSTRLDPFTKQIYALPTKKEKDKDGKWLAIMIHAGIQGLLTVADRSGQYDGSDPIEWCGKDGNWTQVWTADDFPFAAKATVWRKDHSRPEVSIAYWQARHQTHWDKSSQKRVMNDVWFSDGPYMLGKCALAAALRKLFPSQLTGIYEEGERPSFDDTTTLERDIAAQQQRIADEAAAAERLKAQGVQTVAPAQPAPARDAVKEVEPPDDLDFDNLSQSTAAADDDRWRNLSCDLIKNEAYQGKTVSELGEYELRQAVEKWVPKVRAVWDKTEPRFRELAEALEKGLEEAQKQASIAEANKASAAAEGAQ